MRSFILPLEFEKSVCFPIIFLLIFNVLFFPRLRAQNLVENGSFENISECPDLMGKIVFAQGWDNPNGGTADLFCNCGYKRRIAAGVPDNSFGTQEAFDGRCYGGFFCSEYGNDRREYLRYTLNEKLEKNQLYCLSFYYSRADYLKLSVKTLGAFFTSKKYQLKDYAPLPQKGSSLPVNNNPAEWHKFSLYFKSKGKEKYLIIGSFSNENNFREVHGNTTPEKGRYYYNNYFAYYYIDEVSVVKISDTSACSCTEDEKTDSVIVLRNEESKAEPNPSKPFQLRSLNFDINKSSILESSFDELDSLADYMFRNPDLKLSISGHTDNTGKTAQNLQLSRDRAKAVADYLKSKGISPGRISHDGYGSSIPLRSNDEEEDRKMNRRVEFLFIHQNR